MNKIKQLDSETINKIAAGEVIENPASVVKELIENSIDADSKAVRIEIKKGGKELIKVTDNGYGMNVEDAKIAFNRHATSKIRTSEDIYSLNTLGFRGEALSSIASIGEVELLTKARNAVSGIKIKLNNGTIQSIEDIGCPEGTTMIVKNIFNNIPARKKNLSSDNYETSSTIDIVNKASIANPQIKFLLKNNGKIILNTPGNGNLLDVISEIYGLEIAQQMIYINESSNNYSIYGYISKPGLTRSTKKNQLFYINNRYVKSSLISKAILEGYKTKLPIKRYPIAIIFVTLPQHMLDVNIHPQKKEVKIFNKEYLNNTIRDSIKFKLEAKSIISDEKNLNCNKINTDQSKNRNKTSITENYIKKTKFRQNEFKFNNIKAPEINEKEIVEEDRSKYKIENINSASNSIIFKSLEPICQIFNTYILVQNNDTILALDQHAAHERLLYEKLIENKKAPWPSQILTKAITVELTHEEINLYISNKDIFENFGFNIEHFGNKTLVIRSVPSIINLKIPSKELFFNILDSIDEDECIENEKLIIIKACKRAIKANFRLNYSEMKRLISDLSNTNYPFTCPHGRPTIIPLLSKDEIEKKFKRK